MKILLAFGIVALTGVTAFAQVERTYSVEPSTTYVTSTPILDEITKFYIHFKNISGKELNIGWKKLSMDMPSGWDYSLCDLGTCYSGIPDGEFVMYTIEKDSSGFLAPNIYPDNIIGTATIRMAVWDNNNPAITDTLTWVITANPQSDVKAVSPNASSLRLYPNPATENLTVDLGIVSNGTLKIVSPTGVVVFRKALLNTRMATVDLSSIAAGKYLVLFTGTSGLNLQTTVVKQ